MFLGVFPTFEKLLILHGLTAYFLNCFRICHQGTHVADHKKPSQVVRFVVH